MAESIDLFDRERIHIGAKSDRAREILNRQAAIVSSNALI